MRKLNRTGTMLAIAVASYCGTANAQQCDSDIQQLRTQIQEQQLGQQPRQDINELLDRAENATAANCQQFVTQARQELQQASDPQQARATDTTTDVQVQQQPADVEVDAGAPQVAVKQQPPKIQVQREAPDVEITQPEAEVSVKQAEPEVVVNQAEPEVEVQQGEPQVEVKQAGEPEVTVVQAGEEQRTDRTDERQAATSPVAAASSGQISDDEAAQLVGKTAVSTDGEEIGDISAVVKSESSDELHAVVDAGGFLGIGERTVAIPLQNGEINRDGDLRLSVTKQDIERMQEYDPARYQQFGLVQ